MDSVAADAVVVAESATAGKGQFFSIVLGGVTGLVAPPLSFEETGKANL